MLSSFATGNELYQAYVNGENPTVSMSIDAQVNDRFFPQVMAETKRGNKNKVVVSGAHLDSVPEGPGINDDGSGTMAQLEIAKQIAKGNYKPRQKIRFLFFGGEEDGLIGSLYYADNLTEAQAKKIVVMLDFDMIASSNFARLVYDGDGSVPGNPVGPPGSGEVERVFTDFWASQGRVSEPIPFDGRSDYAGFIDRGIPAGGIFAGAEAPKTAEQVAKYGGAEGEQLDPCYHAPCDRLSSILAAPPAEVLLNPANGSDEAVRWRPALDEAVPAGNGPRNVALRQGEEPDAGPRGGCRSRESARAASSTTAATRCCGHADAKSELTSRKEAAIAPPPFVPGRWLAAGPAGALERIAQAAELVAGAGSAGAGEPSSGARRRAGSHGLADRGAHQVRHSRAPSAAVPRRSSAAPALARTKRSGSRVAPTNGSTAAVSRSSPSAAALWPRTSGSR